MFLKGLYTALITPFNHQGLVNETCLRELIRLQIKHQVDGIVVLGSTGEAPTLKSKEKERIIEIAREETSGKIQFLVGSGTYSTEQTIENTELAQKYGADAALVVTPYYNRPTQEGLYRHFKALSEQVSIPICLYNVPGRTGQNMHTETIQRLITLPQIIGIKECSGNMFQVTDVVQLARQQRHLSVLSGDDALTLPIMALGGHGIISVASNLVPAPLKALVVACQSGDFTKAQSIHYQLLPLFKGAFLETNPSPIKLAMNLCGLEAGPCRLPLCELSGENQKQLESILSTLPKEWITHG